MKTSEKDRDDPNVGYRVITKEMPNETIDEVEVLKKTKMKTIQVKDEDYKWLGKYAEVHNIDFEEAISHLIKVYKAWQVELWEEK